MSFERSKVFRLVLLQNDHYCGNEVPKVGMFSNFGFEVWQFEEVTFGFQSV